MNNFLIQESAFSNTPVISKKNEHTVEFIAVLQEADRPNRNGRIYYKTVLEQALQSPYIQERLRTNSFFGEAGHPSDTSVQRQMTIDQRNIACLIKEFWWEGNLLKARIETANTVIGRDMKGLIEQGSRVAFSLRAQGNVHFDQSINATIVEAPIQIATYDWVVNPSHDKAFLETICEDTRCSLFGVKESSNRLVLAESINLFENGNLISLTEVTQPVVVDYARNFWKKVKPLSEAYLHTEGDKLAVADKIATVVNENVTKKVVLEDFLLKDIRSRILKLTESELGDAAAEPVHTDAPAKEHTPEVENKDILVGQHADEVKEVVVESEHKLEVSKPEEQQYKVEEEIAPTDAPEAVVKTEVKSGEIVVQPHDHADAEGKQVRDELHEELGDAAAEPVHTDAAAKEQTPEVENKDILVGQHAEEVEEASESEETVEVATDVKPEVMVSSDTIRIEIPVEGKELSSEVSEEKMEELKESLRRIHTIFSSRLNEEESVEVPMDAEADVKVEGDKLVIEIPVESPKEVISSEESKEVESEVQKISESLLGDAAAEPVHTDAAAKEHTPEVENKDVLVGQHAEEVKEVIVEEKGPSVKELKHIEKVGPEEYAKEGAKSIPVVRQVKVVKGGK
jgi:hypothetical protein